MNGNDGDLFRWTRRVLPGVLALALLPAAALAESPALIPIHGRLLDAAGEPLTGTVEVTFSLYDASNGGARMHQETQDLAFDEGRFNAYIGKGKPLDIKTITLAPDLYLSIEIEQDGELSPRLQLASAPYSAFAQYCAEADTLDGMGPEAFMPSSFKVTWDDIQNVPFDFTDRNDADTLNGLLADMDCVDGKIAKIVSGAWTCTDDATSGGAGVHLSDLQGSCTMDQVVKWSGSAWTCAMDNDTPDTDTDSLASLLPSCSDGDVVKRISSVWACGMDEDTNLTVPGAAGDLLMSSGAGALSVSALRSGTIPGGQTNTAGGNWSFAGGRRAKSNNAGCFTWGDSTDADISCSTDNAWVARASGGVTFYTDAGASTGVNLAAGGGMWSMLSDRNAKTDVGAVDGREVLREVASLPIHTWRYKSQDASVRHMGPMAQDFRASFGLGDDDTHIGTGDLGGVSLAAVQGLNALVEEQAAEIDSLNARVAKLESLLHPTQANAFPLWTLPLLAGAAFFLGRRRST